MEMGGEQNSDGASMGDASSQGFESLAAKPLQLEATAHPAAQVEPAEKDSLTTRIPDEGRTRAVLSQFVEPSGEPEKISSAGPAMEMVRPSAPRSLWRCPSRPPLILFATRWRPSIAETMRQLSGFSRRAARKTPPLLSKGHGRRSIGEIMRRLSGFSSRLARRMSADQKRGNPGQLFRLLLRLRRQERDRRWRPIPGLDGVSHHRQSMVFLLSILQAVCHSVSQKIEILDVKDLFCLDQAC